MPIDKNKQERFSILNECLRDSHKRYHYDTLLEEVNRQLTKRDLPCISIRTLKNDINQMVNEYDVELDDTLWDQKQKVLRYADLSDSIYKTSKIETTILKQTIDMLINMEEPHPLQFDYVRLCLQQILKNRHINIDNAMISFSDNLDHKGREHFLDLCKYIMDKQTIRISYLTYSGNAINADVFPYCLKQYNERWFLIGRQKEYTNLTNYALDRIEKIEESSVKYQETTVDFSTYFDDIIGVTKNTSRKTEDIYLKISAERYPYIATKPLNPYQKLIKDMSNDEYKVIKIPLIANLELEGLILFYGSDIEVLKPEWLRNKIANRLSDALAKYNKN